MIAPPPRQWTALLLAGSRPGGDAFAEANGVPLKPLIPVRGEPMIRRPLRTLLASPAIKQVRVLTQQPAAIAAVLPAGPRVTVDRSGATIASTIEAILADPATRFPLLVTTADHALLDPEMIADFCARADGVDVAIGVVERRALEAILPQAKRTWIGFRGGAYSGANLFAFASADAVSAVSLWREVEQDRKKGWRMLAAFGPALLLGAGLRLRTLDRSLATIGRKLGLSVCAVIMTDPLVAVDVDKPSDLAMVEAILRDRA